MAAGGGARRDRAGAEQQRDDRGGLRAGELLAQPGEVAARDVAGLVRQHADDLVRGLGVVERADVHEDAAAVHHERVERARVDQHDLDVLLAEPGGAQDRRRVVAQQLLDLGVADDRQAGRVLRSARLARHDDASAVAAAMAREAGLASRDAGIAPRGLF